MKKFVFLLALGLFAADRAAADTIVTNVAGTGGNFDLVSTGGSATITFSDSFTTAINNSGIAAAVTVFGTFTIGTTPTLNPPAGATGYTFSGTVTETITFPALDGGGTTVLTLTGGSANVDSTNTLNLLGTLVLFSNSSTTYNFSQFTPTSTFHFELGVTPGSGALFNTLIQDGTPSNQPANYVTGTGAFQEADPAAVPEPSSLALLGMGSFSMVGYFWRRRRSALIAM